ncbi:unnamed protein product [Staurois parvus]|uniref:Uncharacterized protein n=1 Tax=Staurois parvus TaxID=386267 RepID=A0ABN9GCD4_9NEOB|nr:unnamed protein product [Staurois parvus]
MLKKYNEQLIEHLEHQDKQVKPEMKHFVDRYQQELTEQMTLEKSILNCLLEEGLLTSEQFKIIEDQKNQQKAMARLNFYISRWNNAQKDALYEILEEQNGPLIELLEEKDKKQQLVPQKEHFVDRYRQKLIERTTQVERLLYYLMIKDLLTFEQCDKIEEQRTNQDRMRTLYFYISGWSIAQKDALYNILKEEHEPMIKLLEEIDMEQSLQPSSEKHPYLPDWTAGGSSLLDVSPDPQPGCSKDPDPGRKADPERSDWSTATGTECAQNIFSPQQSDRLQCALCGKDEDSAVLVLPVITGMQFSLELQSAGLFRCSKTGIKFEVTRPVTIEFQLESWSSYGSLLQNLQNDYEILGPIFNIKTDLEPGVVSAVYLPHCLCIKGLKEDTSCIKCLHFKDDNLSLEHQLELSRTMLSWRIPPSPLSQLFFYPLKLIRDGIKRLIAIHGMVLIYWRISGITDPDHRKFRIHLYLMPCNQSVEMDIDNNETKDPMEHYYRLRKPHQTDSLYSGQTYEVKASQNGRVLPRTLQFQCSYVSRLYPYTEITVDGKEINDRFTISIEDGGSSVWQAEVDRGKI